MDQTSTYLSSPPHLANSSDHSLISDLLGLPAGKVAETLSPYSLRDLGQMTEVELKQAGLTPGRAKRLRSAFELARRYSTAGKALVLRPGSGHFDSRDS